MVYAKEYLKKYGTLLKVDILNQYEPSQAPVISSEITAIIKTVKVVKPSVKASKPKKAKAVLSGTLIKRVEHIFKFLEAQDRRQKESLEIQKNEYDFKVKGFELKQREYDSIVAKNKEQVEFLKQQQEKLKLENRILTEKLKQISPDSV